MKLFAFHVKSYFIHIPDCLDETNKTKKNPKELRARFWFHLRE